jgi:hypothetical protein
MNDADRAHRIQVASYRRQSRQAASKPNQLVPENTVAGNALTIVIAIMSFLACLTLGAVTLVRDASRDWQLDVQREVTIQVRPVEGVDIEEAAALAAAIARQTAGVAGVEVLDASENASAARAVARRRPRPHRSADPEADRRAADRTGLGRDLPTCGAGCRPRYRAPRSTTIGCGRRDCRRWRTPR